MINKSLSFIAYCLRWLAWAFHYLVIWPVATLVLIVALLFCLDNTTPGAVAVDYLQKAGSITDGQHWRWRECPKLAPGEFPPPPVYPDKSESLLQEACPEVVSGAREYAAYIDRTLWGTLSGLWILMAMTYSGLAWLLGIRPYFSLYVFVEVAGDRGYIRRAFTRPERGMGEPAVFPVKKAPGKHQGCDVYVSSLSFPTVDKSAEWPENEDEKR